MNQRDSGSILDGKYEILQRLATGGMGEVWKARHIHLQELRVIKILRSDKATDPLALQRFSQEARIATQIKHPNVAILYDFSRLADGSFYMVWEHIEGEDVGTRLRRLGPFPVSLAIDLGIQALRGLEAIHAAGVIHRDLSPDNLMLTQDRRGRDQIKIIDLGLAKNLATGANLEITQAGMFMGKLAYCSPEQAGSIKDGSLDHRSDLYSLAVVLYEMVSGKLPFDSESQHGFVLKRLTESPLPLIGRNSSVSVPADLHAVVMRGLERDRNRRWPDAISFLQALVRVAEQQRKVATQEIPRVVVPPAPGPSAPVRPTQAPELSREEKLELLAQIDRAAKKVHETSRLYELAQAAARAGRNEDARRQLAELEAISPSHPGVQELRKLLGLPAASAATARPAPSSAGPQAAPETEAPRKAVAGSERRETAAGTPGPTRPKSAAEPAPSRAPAPAQPTQKTPPVPSAPVPPPAPAPPAPAIDPETAARLAEAEKLLERYLREHKGGLARFALETLLELAPNHPKRKDYETWVRLLDEEVELLRECEALLAEGREALLRGDLNGARARLEQVERRDPSHRLADALRAEIEAAQARAEQASELERRRQRMEQLLEQRRIQDAEKELERLAQAGMARVSIETMRLRVQDIARLAEQESRAAEYERRYRERVAAHDWMGAREVVLEFEKEVPNSQRPAQLFAEVSRLEEIGRRQEGIAQGLKQLEAFLAERRLAEAELALKVLVQLDPEFPQRVQVEQRLRALKQGS